MGLQTMGFGLEHVDSAKYTKQGEVKARGTFIFHFTPQKSGRLNQSFHSSVVLERFRVS